MYFRITLTELSCGAYPKYTSNASFYQNFFSVSVAKTVPEGTEVSLKITVSDGSSHTWEDRITFKVYKLEMDFALIGYSFMDDGSGNGDNTLNIGETGYIDAVFLNAVGSTHYGVAATLKCSTPGVIITKGASSAYDYGSGQYRSVGGKYGTTMNSVSYFYKKDFCFAVSVPQTIEEGSKLEFTFVLADRIGNTIEFPFEITATRNEMDFSLVDYSFKGESGNGDSVINIGETGWIDTVILNKSDKKNVGIQATLECDTEGVTIIDALSPTYDYEAGQYRTLCGRSGTNSSLSYFYDLSRCFKITVSPTLKENTVITFKLVLTDGVGNRKEYPFTVTAKKADYNLTLAGYKFSDNSNNNGKLEIGEEGKLDVCFYNSGTEKARISKVELVSETSGVIVTDSEGKGGDCKAGMYSTLSAYSYDSPQYFRYSGDHYFSVKIGGDIEEGTEVKLKVRVTDNLGIVSEYPIVFTAQKQELGVDLDITYTDKKEYEAVYQGEDLSFTTKLTNKSSSSIVHTSVTISTDSKWVTPSSLTYDYTGVIESGKSSTKKWVKDESLTFSVDKSAPLGTVITFNVLASDMTGKTKEYTLTKTVGLYSFSPVIYEPLYSAYDTQGGESISAGSYVYMDVIIANFGPYGKKSVNGKTVYPGEGSNVTIKVVSNSPELIVLKDTCTIGTASSGYYYVASRGSQSKYWFYDYSLQKIKEKYTNTSSGFELKIADSAATGTSCSYTAQVLEGGKVVEKYEGSLSVN